MLRQPFVLVQNGNEDRTAELDRRWAADATFAYAARRTGVETPWFKGAARLIPQEFAQGHFCLLTSGTTGKPKLMVTSKARAERMCAVLHREQELEPVEEAIVALPLTYCYALINQWLWARTARRRLRLTPGLMAPDGLRRALAESRNAMLCLVGPQVPLMIETFGGHRFPGVIRLNFAGGRFPQERLADIRRLFPQAAVFNNYGCAEAMPRLALRRAEASDDALEVGRPLPGVDLRTAADGSLEFRSPFSAAGQIDEDGFHAFGDDWIPTGDLAEPTGRGTWRLSGRAGEVFKRFGEKIAIPQLLATASRVWAGQMGTYRERDSRGEDGYVLVCSPEPDAESLQRLLQALRTGHPRTHWPLRIESIGNLPLSGHGKVNGAALAAAGDKRLHWRQRI